MEDKYAALGIIAALIVGIAVGANLPGGDTPEPDNFTYKTADVEPLEGNLTGWSRYYYIEDQWREIVLVENENDSRLYLEGEFIPHQGEVNQYE